MPMRKLLTERASWEDALAFADASAADVTSNLSWSAQHFNDGIAIVAS